MSISNVIHWLFRIVTGALFIFSGIIKANDSLGFAYKLEEYFSLFGIGFLNPVSVELAIFICILEVFLGITLILGSFVFLTLSALLGMIIFFTILTFYSAYFDKVTDCGCFGDAIPLTPWQSFYKDIILLILIGFLFLKRNLIKPLLPLLFNNIILIALSAGIIGFSLYTYIYLPVWDFRPYSVGSDIYEKMQVPEGGQPDVYETIVFYKNKETGKIEGFPTNNLPSGEEWEWHNTESKLIVEGDHAEILDFNINTVQGDNMTDFFLYQEGYRLLIVSYNLNKAGKNAQEKLNRLAGAFIKETGNPEQIWALSSSSDHIIEEFSNKYELAYNIYLTDATVLKTIIRSNPGLLLLKDNTILKKWPSTALPSENELLRYIRQ